MSEQSVSWADAVDDSESENDYLTVDAGYYLCRHGYNPNSLSGGTAAAKQSAIEFLNDVPMMSGYMRHSAAAAESLNVAMDYAISRSLSYLVTEPSDCRYAIVEPTTEDVTDMIRTVARNMSIDPTGYADEGKRKIYVAVFVDVNINASIENRARDIDKAMEQYQLEVERGSRFVTICDIDTLRATTFLETRTKQLHVVPIACQGTTTRWVSVISADRKRRLTASQAVAEGYVNWYDSRIRCSRVDELLCRDCKLALKHCRYYDQQEIADALGLTVRDLYSMSLTAFIEDYCEYSMVDSKQSLSHIETGKLLLRSDAVRQLGELDLATINSRVHERWKIKIEPPPGITRGSRNQAAFLAHMSKISMAIHGVTSRPRIGYQATSGERLVDVVPGLLSQLRSCERKQKFDIINSECVDFEYARQRVGRCPVCGKLKDSDRLPRDRPTETSCACGADQPTWTQANDNWPHSDTRDSEDMLKQLTNLYAKHDKYQRIICEYDIDTDDEIEMQREEQAGVLSEQQRETQRVSGTGQRAMSNKNRVTDENLSMDLLQLIELEERELQVQPTIDHQILDDSGRILTQVSSIQKVAPPMDVPVPSFQSDLFDDPLHGSDLHDHERREQPVAVNLNASTSGFNDKADESRMGITNAAIFTKLEALEKQMTLMENRMTKLETAYHRQNLYDDKIATLNNDMRALSITIKNVADNRRIETVNSSMKLAAEHIDPTTTSTNYEHGLQPQIDDSDHERQPTSSHQRFDYVERTLEAGVANSEVMLGKSRSSVVGISKEVKVFNTRYEFFASLVVGILVRIQYEIQETVNSELIASPAADLVWNRIKIMISSIDKKTTHREMKLISASEPCAKLLISRMALEDKHTVQKITASTVMSMAQSLHMSVIYKNLCHIFEHMRPLAPLLPSPIREIVAGIGRSICRTVPFDERSVSAMSASYPAEFNLTYSSMRFSERDDVQARLSALKNDQLFKLCELVLDGDKFMTALQKISPVKFNPSTFRLKMLAAKR
ncbi:hypothetical protein HDV05_004416 [Chytridiales sp. JEL 0842]|nr:hypothetical protein HDV05_004416 [Chytridiales sp. JEL 0842]